MMPKCWHVQEADSANLLGGTQTDQDDGVKLEPSQWDGLVDSAVLLKPAIEELRM